MKLFQDTKSVKNRTNTIKQNRLWLFCRDKFVWLYDDVCCYDSDVNTNFLLVLLRLYLHEKAVKQTESFFWNLFGQYRADTYWPALIMNRNTISCRKRQSIVLRPNLTGILQSQNWGVTTEQNRLLCWGEANKMPQ